MILPILTYHRILSEESTSSNDPKRISVSQQQFRSHLIWLKRFGYRTIPLSVYVDKLRKKESIPSRSFGISFDDGYEEVLTLGLPLLQEFGFTAAIFAVPGEERNRWDDNQARLLTSVQLRQWRDAGMEVGAHSCRHLHLTQVDPEIARREMVESKQSLEEVLKQPVTLFAYPYGETDDRVDALAREAGFEAAFATDRAPRDHAAHPYRLRRTVVFPRNTVWEIWCKVQRWYPAYQDWKRR